MPASLPRAVLDPNVLVSAAISDRGIPAELIRRSERGEFELVTSAEVLMELLEVLRRPKFRSYITEDEAVVRRKLARRDRPVLSFRLYQSGSVVMVEDRVGIGG